MSTTITTAFIRQYEADVHDVFQQAASYLLATVRHKRNVVGTSTTFQVIGTGTATTKARHGVVTPMNQTHTAVTATLADFYAGDWVDRLDEAKTNIDERMAIARGGAGALGRKIDSQITTQLDATTQTTITWTLSTAKSVRNALLDMCQALDANAVPNDGRRYGALTSMAWAHASTVAEFASADYVDAMGRPFTTGAPGNGRFRYWNGVYWCMHPNLPGAGTSTAKVFTWHQDAVGYASGKSAGNIAGNPMVKAEITYHGDRVSHFVNHFMSGQAALIDDTGVIEGNLNDTTALATS